MSLLTVRYAFPFREECSEKLPFKYSTLKYSRPRCFPIVNHNVLIDVHTCDVRDQIDAVTTTLQFGLHIFSAEGNLSNSRQSQLDHWMHIKVQRDAGGSKERARCQPGLYAVYKYTYHGDRLLGPVR